MKILKYLDTIDRGGAEMQVLDVCRNASRYGLDITLVTRGGALSDDIAETGVDLITVDRRLPLDPLLIRRLARIIKEKEIDIVHGYQAVDGIHLYLATLGMKTVARVLSFQGFVQQARERRIAAFLLPRMDANIVVSRGLLNWLAENRHLKFGSNTRIIYNGADPARLAPTGHSLKAELGLTGETRLIGMVGNFYRDARKDQMTVCRSLPDVFARFPDVHCVFAGGVEIGAEDKRAECEQICRDAGIAARVHFLGARRDVPDILSELDIFIFSSLHEGLPVAVSEAMLAGVCLIISDIPPLMEATGDGTVASVFPVGDENALAGRLTELLIDDTARAELAQKAKKYAAEHFSIDAHLRLLSELYSELIEKNIKGA